VAGVSVTDEIRPDKENKSLTRTLRVKGNVPATMKCRLATGKNIVKVGDNLYNVDKKYYVQAAGASVRNLNTTQELWLPAAAEMSYSVLW
jgi:hypothetical protein